MLQAASVLSEIQRLLVRSGRDSHVTWIWGGTYEDSVIVVYRWMREAELGAYHCDVVDFASLFDPIDTVTLAEIVVNEIEEPGKRRVIVPVAIQDAVPVALRSGLFWGAF